MDNKYNHYIIKIDWSFDLNSESTILLVTHSKDAAKQKFLEAIENEITKSWIFDKIELTDKEIEQIKNNDHTVIMRNDYTLICDLENFSFEAYNDGWYNDTHTCIDVDCIQSED